MPTVRTGLSLLLIVKDLLLDGLNPKKTSCEGIQTISRTTNALALIVLEKTLFVGICGV